MQTRMSAGINCSVPFTWNAILITLQTTEVIFAKQGPVIIL